MIRRLTAMTVALLALITGVVLSAGSASADVSTGPLTLTADQHLDSARAVLYMQYDGNLVLYKDNRAVWDTGTQGSGPESYMAFQDDGNLVVYWRRFALWNSHTDGNYGARLVLTDDGNLLIINASGRIVWETGTGDPLPPPPDPCGEVQRIC
jgi:hypothetical protein